MPKLYEYFGLTILFYANEHDPVHVHGKCQGRECRAELILVEGQVTEIRYLAQKGRPLLDDKELRIFQELVSAKSADIVQKWIEYFVLHKTVQTEKITTRLK
ncbi:MAG: DUF4160 domain-containing protein [Verrucomicrobiota bacterium]|jgi:hypothetical protein